MIQKPIKQEEGRLKEFKSTDELPNQPDIQELQQLLALLVFELVNFGFEIKDKRLTNLIEKSCL